MWLLDEQWWRIVYRLAEGYTAMYRSATSDTKIRIRHCRWPFGSRILVSHFGNSHVCIHKVIRTVATPFTALQNAAPSTSISGDNELLLRIPLHELVSFSRVFLMRNFNYSYITTCESSTSDGGEPRCGHAWHRRYMHHRHARNKNSMSNFLL